METVHHTLAPMMQPTNLKWERRRRRLHPQPPLKFQVFRRMLIWSHTCKRIAPFHSHISHHTVNSQLIWPDLEFCPSSVFRSSTFMLSDFLSHSSVRGYTGQQGLPGGWRLMLKWWDLQPTSADFASVCGRQRQHEVGPRCQKPVCQRSVCPAVQPITWLPV